jgi:hypothetical protein
MHCHTYRTHGPNMNNPCHMELIFTEKKKLFLNQKRRLYRRKKKLKKQKHMARKLNSA